MTKKVEVDETCTHEKCNCGRGHCSSKLLVICLSAVAAIFSIITCLIACGALKIAQKSYNLNVIPAGWEENLNKLMEMYRSEAYIKYATEQTDAQIQSFNSVYGNTNTDTEDENTTPDEDNTNTNSNVNPDDVKSVVEDMLKTTPIRWDKDARFTIIEYTELLCPYCQRHSQAGTINSVIEQLPWEVNSVSRHFIIHGDEALQLASAMECVSELKAEVYHEVFDKAFAAYPVNMEWLIGIATELWVDKTALQTCIDEWRYTQKVQDMMNQWAELFGVSGTPGNVIVDRETWKFTLVSGAYPTEEIVKAINELKNA